MQGAEAGRVSEPGPAGSTGDHGDAVPVVGSDGARGGGAAGPGGGGVVPGACGSGRDDDDALLGGEGAGRRSVDLPALLPVTVLMLR